MRHRGESSRSRPGAPRPAARDAPLGGQAVLEGVMMRGIGAWAVAVRAPAPAPVPDAGRGSLPDPDPTGFGTGQGAVALGAGRGPAALGEVRVTVVAIPAPASGQARSWRRLPLLRGIVALWESLRIGTRALAISAAAQLPDGREEIPPGAWAVTSALSLLFALGLFFAVPVGATSLIRTQLGSSWAFWLVEGTLRIAIFLGYLLAVSRMRELRRMLEYHGAEHKVIACHEAGEELTPERAARHSRLHPRCGTSFLLLVMLISLAVFAPIGLPVWWVLVLTRIAGVPVIAGLAFEVIRLAARHRDRRLVRLLMWPGMRLQLLTTREPDLDELAVSIASLRAVLAHEHPGERDAADLVGLEVAA